MALIHLQSRLMASLAASFLLLSAYLVVLLPQIAIASDLPPIRAESDQTLEAVADQESFDGFEPSYQPDFAFFDRSIIGRAPSGVTPLTNNEKKRLNLDSGRSACYVFTTGTLSTQDDTKSEPTTTAESNQRRDVIGGDGENVSRTDTSSRKLYISGNTCLQPTQTDAKAKDRLPPQLTIAVSKSGASGCPKTVDEVPEDHRIEFEEGSGTLSLETMGDVFISIFAPSVSDGFDGVYNFEVAVSTDDYFHQYIPSSGDVTKLLWFDSDSSAALLTTQNLTSNTDEYDKYLKMDPLPFKLFVENDKYKMFDGLRRSVCGMRKQARSFTQDLLKTSMTTRGVGKMPKQEFYFNGLNSSTKYHAVMVKMGSGSKGSTAKTTRQTDSQEEEEDNEGNGEVGGGGTVFDAVEFDTLTGSTCKILTNLEFCSDVQYAVPGNGKLNNTELVNKYDNYAKGIFDNFGKVMQQVPCDADNTSRYSLVTDCEQCLYAYKRWLCAVSIPRCVDYASPNEFAVVRNVNESFPNGTMVPEEDIDRYGQKLWHRKSRNQFIDEEISPGPYKEILPCDDLCYEVVRKCPASIGFTCPKHSYSGFEGSYQGRVDGNVLECNSPGEPRTPTSGAGLLQAWLPLFSIILLSTITTFI